MVTRGEKSNDDSQVGVRARQIYRRDPVLCVTSLISMRASPICMTSNHTHTHTHTRTRKKK